MTRSFGGLNNSSRTNSWCLTSERKGLPIGATFIGEGGPRFYMAFLPEAERPEYAVAIINATSRRVIVEEIVPRIEEFCAEQFPDLTITLNPLQMGPPDRVADPGSGFQARTQIGSSKLGVL